jgi:hypothetical protein
LCPFGVQLNNDPTYQLHTVAGSQFVGKVLGKPLLNADGTRAS